MSASFSIWYIYTDMTVSLLYIWGYIWKRSILHFLFLLLLVEVCLICSSWAVIHCIVSVICNVFIFTGTQVFLLVVLLFDLLLLTLKAVEEGSWGPFFTAPAQSLPWLSFATIWCHSEISIRWCFIALPLKKSYSCFGLIYPRLQASIPWKGVIVLFWQCGMPTKWSLKIASLQQMIQVPGTMLGPSILCEDRDGPSLIVLHCLIRKEDNECIIDSMQSFMTKKFIGNIKQSTVT